MIDRHLIAEISLAGTAFDVLGGLYLAYDLLGGPKGPLRTLTRLVTYSLVFFLGYALTLGVVYGLVAGLGLGAALGIEFWRVGKVRAAGRSLPRWESLAFGFFRGLVQGLAAGLTFGARFGAIFGLLSGLGLVLVYALGFAVATEYVQETRPRWSGRKLLASALRGLVVGISGAIAGALSGEGGLSGLFGLQIGLTVGLISAVVGTLSPFVEYWADHLPERRLGAMGIGLTMIGFLLLSIQYIVVLLGFPIQ